MIRGQEVAFKLFGVCAFSADEAFQEAPKKRLLVVGVCNQRASRRYDLVAPMFCVFAVCTLSGVSSNSKTQALLQGFTVIAHSVKDS